jgi:RNA-directed DNA polymerase
MLNFSPAISDKAAVKIREEVHKWKLHKRTDKFLEELAEETNPMIRGWINHYGMFHKSKLDEVLKWRQFLFQSGTGGSQKMAEAKPS